MSSFKSTQKTVVTSVSGKLSEGFDKVMQKGSEMLDKGMEMLDAGMDMVDEVLDSGDSKEVTTTIRIGLDPEHIAALQAGKTVQFKAGGTTILIESEKV